MDESAPDTVAIITLGCRLNQADAALMTAAFEEAGFRVLPPARAFEADVVVVNSCTVTGTAAAKTRKAVRSVRRRNPGAMVILAGCFVDASTKNEGRIRDAFGVDLLTGNAGKPGLPRIVRDMLPQRKSREASNKTIASPTDSSSAKDKNGKSPRGAMKAAALPAERTEEANLFRIPFVGRYMNRTRAHLKVQEGCDVGCTYCIVPAARGRPRSRDPADALREARALIERGHRELVVTGVNLSLYRAGDMDLADLVAALCELPGDFRIRLGSVEYWPGIFRLLDIMQTNPRLCRFLHVPLQHGSDRILQEMGRRLRAGEFADFARETVARVPDVCLGTDIICGFPGETKTAFRETRELLERLPLAYAHVFPWSPRPGTPAATFPDRVPPATAAERTRLLRDLSERKSADFARRFIGRILRVLTEKRRGRPGLSGWSDNYLDVDILSTAPAPAPGVFVDVQITEAVRGRRVQGVIARP